MKSLITKFLLTAAGVAGLAAPSMFAADRYDVRRDVRADRWRLHEDLEHGRYRQAARVRADIRRDVRRDRRW